MKKTAREKINEFIAWCNENSYEYALEVKISKGGDGEEKYAIAKAKLRITKNFNLVRSSVGHKIVYQKPIADGMQDTSYVSAAETMAISRAISFAMYDDSDIHSAEDFDELLIFNTKRISDLYKISEKSARDFISTINNEELKSKCASFLDAIVSRAAVNAAAKDIMR